MSFPLYPSTSSLPIMRWSTEMLQRRAADNRQHFLLSIQLSIDSDILRHGEG
jgi:hypothetical protein